jgi:biopolymer transport protein ExbB
MLDYLMRWRIQFFSVCTVGKSAPGAQWSSLRLRSFSIVKGIACALIIYVSLPGSMMAQTPAVQQIDQAPADGGTVEPIVGALQPASAAKGVASEEPASTSAAASKTEKATAFLSIQEMLDAGGMIGYLILGFSVVMVALIIDYVLNIRRSTLMPPGLAEEIHRCLAERKFEDGKVFCRKHPGFLSRVLYVGLDEAGLNYGSIEKAMEDAATEQSSRLFRRIEYLSVISTLAPMLGLMGTVWGMILAFLEFEQNANPQPSELAPGIYRALVTTLFGLGVAIPSMAAFAFFRNRVDELTAETVLLAEHVFADYRRLQMKSPNQQKPTRS